MPPRRGRPRAGDRRIDAAIDHFGAMGYPARAVRAVVVELLKVYGGPTAWPLLEEGAYEVVQNRLFEKEDEEKQKQAEPQPLEYHHQEEDQQVLQEPPQHKEPGTDEAPPDNISILEVYHESPAEIESVDEEGEDPMFIEPHALEAVVPRIRTGETRRPCYGWIIESEDESEDEEQPQLPT
ncbi:hypothetical protein U9M48_012630 [Paspalum notatum var. saurae]|uniref:WIYLD domain-containing protein n=1 Tax=Paspalum notatum var. saurae TaxID=547442 RepID=A0AAQ3T024_PASNO